MSNLNQDWHPMMVPTTNLHALPSVSPPPTKHYPAMRAKPRDTVNLQTKAGNRSRVDDVFGTTDKVQRQVAWQAKGLRCS